jgi:Asp-tRNA(Asn)/Glu-tRNA(Gln) amidotransferase A subunit family amidase
LICSGDLSPVELLDSCISRIEEINPKLNALVACCPERARAEARAAEAAIIRGDKVGLLHGLPIGIKDLNNTAGLRTTYGSLIYENHVPDKDERVVAAVRKAGAIVLGKTNTPEFGAGATTNNLVYGATKNPFDITRTCGGSTGGGAVALATGMITLATGSDSGGSLRTPAAFCGIVGFRPTPGLVPSERRVVGFTPFNVQGPLGRCVADAALLLSAMAGDDNIDPLASPVDTARLGDPEPIDLSQINVAVSEDLGIAPVDNHIRAIFRQRLQSFSSVFGNCTFSNPDLIDSGKVFWVLRAVNYLANFKTHYDTMRDKLGDNVRNNVEDALKVKPEEIAWAFTKQTQLYRKFQGFFEEFDALITPAASVSPFSIDAPFCTHINGDELDHYVRWTEIAYAISLTGHPVVVIPCGLDSTGTPFGIQIVGPRRGDRFTLGLALSLERIMSEDPTLSRPVPNLGSLRVTASLNP